MENKDSYSADNNNDENAVKAKVLKELGNEEFHMKNYAKSIEYYSRAIDLKSISSKDRSILYSNRCIAFIKLNELKNAIKDAKQVLKLRPQWWKGYYRLAQSYYAKQDRDNVIKCENILLKAQFYERNEEITQLLNEVRYKVEIKDTHNDFRYERQQIDNHLKLAEKATGHKVGKFVEEMQDFFSSSKDPLVFNHKDCKEGHKYCLGTDGYPVDYEKAMKFYSMAADRGSAEAYLSLALMVCERNDVKKDFGLAFKYLLKAAELPPYVSIKKGRKSKNFGVSEAEYMLAVWYETGIYVEQNIREAVNWYEKSFGHENIYSAFNLATLYMGGDAVIERDIERAEQLFKYAAIGRHAAAMTSLPTFYLENVGNPKMAIKWCEWCRENGYNEPKLNYIEMRAKFELSMTPSNVINKSQCSEDNKKYLTNPHRRQVITEHRHNIKNCFEFDDFQYYVSRTSIPPKIQKSEKSLQGLESICLNDMNPTLDKVYNGYLINVKSIDIVSSAGLSLELVIEDNNKDVERCFIYNSPLINDLNLANQLYGIGCQFSVINPYYRISMDLKPSIRIDDINSIVFRDYMENMCRYCCEANATKHCSRCKTAMYCTKECQTNDWKKNSHKLICTKL